MGIIIVETVVIIVLGTLGVYLVWLLSGRKKSFGKLLETHGYTIGIMLFIIVGVTIALFRTFFQ